MNNNSIYKYQPVVTTGPFGTDYRPTWPQQDPEQNNSSGVSTVDLCELDGWRYVSVPDNSPEPTLPEQIASTWQLVSPLTPELREQIKATSTHTQLIAQRVIDKIREKYPLDEELYFARIAVGALQGSYMLLPGEAESLAQYQLDVESAREWGRLERAKLGL